MAFTFAQTNTDNSMATYDLGISINPTAAIISDKVFEVGDSAAGTIGMTNTGATTAGVFLTADWGPSAGTTDRLATVLANALVVSVTVSSATLPDTTVYTGSLIGLIDVSINNFSVGDNTDVKISVAVPGDRTGPTLLDKAIHVDWVFVAVSTQ